MTPHPSEAGRIVSELCGAGVRDVHQIQHGVMTFKFLVDTERDERYMVRFYPPGRESVVDCEPDLLARCREVGLPVPVVVGDSRLGPAASLNYIVYRAIDGEMLSHYLTSADAGSLTTLAAELTALLDRFERIDLEGYGELSTARAARRSSWIEFVGVSCEAGLAALEGNPGIDAGVRAAIGAIVPRAEQLAAVDRRRLVWGDISFDNVLVDRRGRVAGLIDFESCLSGDPLAILGYAYAAHGHQPFCGEMIRAKGLSGDEYEAVLFYAVLRGLRLAPYLHLPLPTGHARNHLFQIFPAILPALSQLTAQS